MGLYIDETYSLQCLVGETRYLAETNLNVRRDRASDFALESGRLALPDCAVDGMGFVELWNSWVPIPHFDCVCSVEDSIGVVDATSITPRVLISQVIDLIAPMVLDSCIVIPNWMTIFEPLNMGSRSPEGLTF